VIWGQAVYVSDKIILGAEHLAKAPSPKHQASSLTVTEGYYRMDLERIIMNINIKKISGTIMPSGYTFQQVMLLNALRRQATSGMLMTNPRVTGYTSFAKAVLAFINDPKAPKTCKKLYEYLVKNGYYEGLDVHLA
tara:strand:- start:66 stop:473 length:408 start_codon:yes stop_codon:yes gene_type:complete